jgi:hypothetical protein
VGHGADLLGARQRWRLRAAFTSRIRAMGPARDFCLVEQGYGVCGARDERPHAGQQQQLVDQLGHDVLPRNGSGKTTTGSRNFGSATACGPLGFLFPAVAAVPVPSPLPALDCPA